jgi:5-methylcytosine-specific restriction enzyme subunit McrC
MADKKARSIKIKNIYYMLSYAFQTLRETGIDSVASENFDNIHDLFAAILIRGISAQVKRGLHRDYVLREESLAGLRGQIRVAETIKQQTMPQGRLVCAYDEFALDSLHNQALKSVMLLLLRHSEVRDGNKSAIRKLLLYFVGVTEVAPSSIRWDALRYHRNNASYIMLIELCRLTVKGLLLTTEAGAHKLASWLQDEEMWRLYERFVLSYYQRHHPDYHPRIEYVNWDIAKDGDKSHLPAMKPDITLSHGGKRLIIDTKYYQKTMQSSYLNDKDTFISGHLYQMFAYVKNSDKDGKGNVAGVLLYAKTDEGLSPDEDHVISGNRISFKTLNLNQDWDAITEQLDKLCLWLKSDECA